MTGRARGECGSAMVEFSITLPLLMCVLLGMFTSGFTFNQKLAVTNGVREGSRYGATLPVSSSCGSGAGTMTCWLTQVANITEQASEGDLGASAPNREICVAYVYPAGTLVSTDRTTKLV